MEANPEKPTNGSFNIDMRQGYALVSRYFEFGQTTISFSAVVRDPLKKTANALHIEGTKAVIAHLQGLVDRAEADQQTGQ